ncbi:MAG: outer membrane beta-barrel protein [Bacteroidetes bacterium]|nr:outer membrane beta-barrel protein [Bacteroidota bacterium]
MSKIKLTLVVIATFLAMTASARSKMRKYTYDGMLRKGFYMGVSGSFNNSWILNQNNYNTLDLFYVPIVRQSEMNYIFTPGGNAGADFGYNFKNKWGIEFEPSFSWGGQIYDDAFSGPVAAVYDKPTKTFKPDYVNVPNADFYFRDDYSYVNVRRVIKFNYINFPIYAKFQTHIGDVANFYLMLGPQFCYRTFASEYVEVNHHEWNGLNGDRIPADQKFQKVDIGLSLKPGVDVYAKDWMYFSMGLNTYIGLTDLNGSSLKDLGWFSKNDVDYQKSRNFYIGIQLGVHFFLTPKPY